MYGVELYGLADRYGRPAKGNDKGNVEGMVGFTRRTFMVPIPHARDIDELNAMLRERCLARQQTVLRGETDTISERLEKDRAAFMDLPPVAFEACDQRPGRVSSQALVRYRNSDYSVPVAYAQGRTPLAPAIRCRQRLDGHQLLRRDRQQAYLDCFERALPFRTAQALHANGHCACR
jgi:hypothetical protein